MNRAALLLSAVILLSPVALASEPTFEPVYTPVAYKLVAPPVLSPAQEQKYQQNRIAERIRELAPRTSVKRAAYLAKAYYKASKRYDVDPQIMLTITTQESRFRPGLEAHWMNRGKPTTDRGIMQVNDVWVTRWNLDTDRLRDDDAYNIMVGARILHILKKQYGTTEVNYFTRYNSSWPPARAKYNRALAPFLHVQTAIDLAAGHPDPRNPTAILFASAP